MLEGQSLVMTVIAFNEEESQFGRSFNFGGLITMGAINHRVKALLPVVGGT
jgi:hypothetical protein